MASGQEVAAIYATVGAEISGFTKGMKSVVGSLKEVGAAIGLYFGAKAVIDFGKESILAASEAQKADVAFAQALGVIGVKYSDVTKSAHGFFAELEKTTGFQRDQVEGSVTRLVQVTGNYGDALKDSSIAANLARARNLDLQTATDLVGRVAEGNTSILKRYGISLEQGTTATEALAELNRRFGTAGAAYMQTFAGKVDNLHNQFHELQVGIGEKLMPVVSIFMDQIFKASGGLNGWIEKLGSAINWMAKVAVGAKTLFSNLTSPIAWKLAGESMDNFQKKVDQVTNQIKNVASTSQQVTEQVKSDFDTAGQAIATVGNNFAQDFASDFSKSFSLFKAGSIDIVSAFEKAIDQMVQKIIESAIIDLVGAIFTGGSFDILSSAGKALGITPHAEGGIFTTPHVGLVAEKGPEAIIPLNKLGEIGESGKGNQVVHNHHWTFNSLFSADQATIRSSVQHAGKLFRQAGFI